MRVEIKDLSPTEKQVTIFVETEKSIKDFYKSAKKVKEKATLPGFRKGKAPMHMVEEIYYANIVEAYANDFAYLYYDEAMADHEVRTLIAPEVIDWKFDKEKELEAVYKIETDADLQLQSYKGIEVVYKPIPVQAEDIDNYIQNLRSRNAIVTEIEGEIQANCDVTFTYEEDGKKSSEVKVCLTDKSENEYEAQFIGKKAGDQFEGIYVKEGAEDKLTCKITIIKVEKSELPDVDDAFAKDLEFDNVEDMKTKIHAMITEYYDQMNNTQKYNSIQQRLIELNKVEIPRKFLYEYAMQYVPKNKSKSPDQQQFMQVLQDVYVTYVIERIVKKIAQVEGIVITDEQRKDFYQRKLNETKRSQQEFFNEDGSVKVNEYLDEELLTDRVFEFVLENAIIVDEITKVNENLSEEKEENKSEKPQVDSSEDVKQMELFNE